MAEGDKPAPLASAVGLTKDIFALLRDACLFLGLVLLLLFPGAFNAILNAAGIVEINNGLVVWKSQLVRTDDQLKVANDTITALRANQDRLVATLNQLAATKTTPAQQDAIRSAEQHVQTSNTAAQQVQRRVQATLTSNASLVAGNAVKAPASAGPPATGLCYQEADPRQPLQRYSVHCHPTRAQCETARGPNRRTVQSACVPVALDDAEWSPRHPGFLGAWYEYRQQPFPAPFPPLPSQ